MPLLALVPASPSDLEAIARVHFASWSRSNHPGFNAIFPKGATPDTLQHWITDMDNGFNDLSKHLMLVKDAEKGSIAAYALWQFCPQRSHDEIEREMLTDHFPLPKDANLEVGNRLIHNGVRKHHEVVAKHFGHGAAHACKFPNTHRQVASHARTLLTKVIYSLGYYRHEPRLRKTRRRINAD